MQWKGLDLTVHRCVRNACWRASVKPDGEDYGESRRRRFTSLRQIIRNVADIKFSPRIVRLSVIASIVNMASSAQDKVRLLSMEFHHPTHAVLPPMHVVCRRTRNISV